MAATAQHLLPVAAIAFSGVRTEPKLDPLQQVSR
jgi:hypothetical protein